MSLPRCARCADGTRATVHLHATGYGAPVDADLCDVHLDVVMGETSRYPNRTRTLLIDNGQDALFDLGGDA